MEQLDSSERTGWANALSQDMDRRLFQWFASRVDARWVLRRVCDEIKGE